MIDKEFDTIQGTNMSFLYFFYADSGDIRFQWGNLSLPYFVFSLYIHISCKIFDQDLWLNWEARFFTYQKGV